MEDAHVAFPVTTARDSKRRRGAGTSVVKAQPEEGPDDGSLKARRVVEEADATPILVLPI